MTVTIEVIGTPGSKGGGRAMLIGGKARYIAGDNSVGAAKTEAWDRAVRVAAHEVRASAGLSGNPAPGMFAHKAPLRVTLVFRLRRPAGHYGKRGLKPSAPAFPASKPDLDKLVRATLDPLTGCIFDDDSRVVAIEARKMFADGVYAHEGATITVEAL